MNAYLCKLKNKRLHIARNLFHAQLTNKTRLLFRILVGCLTLLQFHFVSAQQNNEFVSTGDATIYTVGNAFVYSADKDFTNNTNIVAVSSSDASSSNRSLPQDSTVAYASLKKSEKFSENRIISPLKSKESIARSEKKQKKPLYKNIKFCTDLLKSDFTVTIKLGSSFTIPTKFTNSFFIEFNENTHPLIYLYQPTLYNRDNTSLAPAFAMVFSARPPPALS